MGESFWRLLLLGACLAHSLAASAIDSDRNTASLGRHLAPGEDTQVSPGGNWGYQALWQAGPQATGVQATGVQAKGVQAAGVQASIEAVQKSVASLAGRLARMEEKLRKLGVVPRPRTSGPSYGVVGGNRPRF
ncbi:uncharacterized protein LOC143020611 [Oratosquilla oratoria]|uniref:uncharacterized protein LOC143020611 n=1 Tax=Oratosquilla oratoria TaxID=337810 RepID=UPI003F765A67